jgi:glycosyltransferase involved in cell wall biosynthesis
MAKREKANLLQTNFVIGRTDWDRRITRILAPCSKYFHSDEILRNSFYVNQWVFPVLTAKFIIQTTNGNSYYKGFETLCLALKLLHDVGFNCEWRVAGISKNDLVYKLARRKLKHQFPEKGLVLFGKLNESELVQSLLESKVYVMVSHIENSPNNLCEAMILGIPCISTFVGGTGTLIRDKDNGLLIQSGDPWAMAGAILELANDKVKSLRLGQNARKVALQRHSKDKITSDLIASYKEIIKQSGISL